jgi:hypothetical protein
MTMKTNLAFRVGTSSRHVSKYSIPRSGPHYIVVGAHEYALVVEDSLHRQLRFLRQLGSTATKIVSRAPDAIRELEARHFDVVFLDRDLVISGGYGEDVAAYLAEIKFPGRVICHSTNSFGAAVIEKTLKDGGINVEVAPFDVLGVFREK